MDARRRGQLGELEAMRYLERRGYRLVEPNFRCRLGEIDLIVRRDEFLVFVEVKTRGEGALAQPAEAVTASKRRRIRSAALFYLSSHDCFLQPRFDVVEVLLGAGDRPEVCKIRHIENAFE
ncbi:YraN family protein [Feifania hominis]|uniref:UPF0102 protein H8695_02720 n=1 Tax=Feifania hominis TaxID=2763660 RepID=A0A926DEL1_9FIRM|nr:YraN family protein [Feifania hominis]MBC8535605.1 YraN family protein [Feifania hominis]